ncbi:MAG: hypothetical protein HFJ10_02685 [Lachnospiraceae bacterium]|nr:hypothetical protein [Lachnospiraceae bacterium]
MRRFKALKNSGFAIASQILIILLQFMNRRIFVLFLSEEYLGANGLFADILSMLSVAELGLGSAIVFAMYKPFAEEDVEKVKALLQFYKSAYIKIGILVTAVGIGLIPFLDFFIKDTSGVGQIEIIYVIVLFNTAITYFFSYKITILTVAQKNYIQNIFNVIFRIIQLGVQILVLYLTQSYIFYLLVQFICTLSNYTIVSMIAKRQYPEYFVSTKECQLPGEEKQELFKNIKALFVHKVSSFLVNGTDNIILSKFRGLATTGFFSNYNLIFQNVFTFFTIPFSAITSTVGNFVALESKEDARKMFWKIDFATYWLAVVCGACLLNLSTPFIELFFGERFGLSDSIAMVMTLNFYLNVMRQPVNVYKNAKGLFWQDRYKTAAESAVNLIVGLVLVNRVGTLSVLLGTTVSAIMAGPIVEVHIIYKYGFKTSAMEYYKRYAQNALIASSIGWLTWSLCSFFTENTFAALVVRGIICVGVSNMILFCCYGRTEEMAYYKGFMKEMLNKVKGNHK